MRPSVVTLAVILATTPANAQAPNQGTTSGTAKTPTGSAPARATDFPPDLEGLWTNDTATPLERPRRFATRAFFDTSEEAAFQAAVREDAIALQGDENVKTSRDIGFTERGKLMPDRRTALIIDPPDGMVPLLPTARQWFNESLERKRQFVAEGPEDFDLAERCIPWPSPPMLPPPVNAQLRIVQTHDYIVIHTEMFDEARVVPMDGRPHLSSAMRQWKGDSRGRWENDTLVVETTNFRPKTTFNYQDGLQGSYEPLRVIERFSLVDADTILYQFTVDDPTAYASTWTAEMPFARATKPMFEFACHEGNYSLKNGLLGARAVERSKAAARQ